MANSATLTFGYEGTDFTRQYKFENLTQAQCEGLKAKVLDFNASIAGGMSAAAGLSSFFVSDDFNGTKGRFASIVGAQYELSTVTDIGVV